MKVIREVGKTYQCWYKGELREATITGSKYRWVWVTARIDGAEKEVTLRSNCVRWDDTQPFRIQDGRKKKKKKVNLPEEEKPCREGIGNAVICRTAANTKDRETVRQSLMRIRNNLCGVGIFSVKARLTFLAKSGDAYASILRHAIEVETVNIHTMEDFATAQALNSYHFQRFRAIKAVVQLCSDNNIPHGMYAKDSTMLCVRLSSGTVIGYPMLKWGVKIKNLPSFHGDWDGKETWNLRRLEDEIYDKYSNILW